MWHSQAGTQNNEKCTETGLNIFYVMHLRYTKKSSETDKEDKEDLTEQPLSPP